MFWFQHIEAWHTSGISQAEYARQHKLSIKSVRCFQRNY
ncbi:IS66 family insertion sequence element accessory protein TnpA [Endozoicomonas sp.]